MSKIPKEKLRRQGERKGESLVRIRSGDGRERSCEVARIGGNLTLKAKARLTSQLLNFHLYIPIAFFIIQPYP